MKQREAVGDLQEQEKAPAPPAGLSVGAEKLWNDALRDFHFNTGDFPLLESACHAWQRAEQARTALDADGLFTTSDSAMQHPHPAVRIERDSMREFRLCWSRLGLVDPGGAE